MKNFVRADAGIWATGIEADKARRVGRSLTMFLPFQMRANELHAANINAAFPLLQTAAQASGTAAVSRRSLYARAGKRLLDLALVFAALPVVLLVVGLCALCLWLEGGRPFYTQERLGRNGKRFRIVKLRTMVRDADARLAALLKSDPELRAEWDKTQKLKSDPRITPVGAFLRRSSLDELPQLWNVLRGDMSLVGPRPMMPDQLPLYGDASNYFAVLPGITGIWQVSVRNESSFAHRNTTDAEYRRGISFGLDLKLLLRTVGVVYRGTGY